MSTHWHSGGCGCSAILRELRSRHTADDGVHAPTTRRIGTGVGQPGRALRQRGLHTLTLHLLHPVALLTDLRPQSGNTEERESKSDAVAMWRCIRRQEAGIFTWRRDQLTLSPIVSWKKTDIASMNCILVGFLLAFHCQMSSSPHFGGKGNIHLLNTLV